jgi:hypothetical protein
MKNKELLHRINELCEDVDYHFRRETTPDDKIISHFTPITRVMNFSIPDHILDYIEQSVRTRLRQEVREYFARNRILFRKF